MTIVLPVGNVALCTSRVEAVEAVSAMIERDAVARRGNQGDASQAVDADYRIEDRACPWSCGQGAGRVVVAWPRHDAPGEATLIGYYGDPLPLRERPAPTLKLVESPPRIDRRRPRRQDRAA